MRERERASEREGERPRESEREIDSRPRDPKSHNPHLFNLTHIFIGLKKRRHLHHVRSGLNVFNFVFASQYYTLYTPQKTEI